MGELENVCAGLVLVNRYCEDGCGELLGVDWVPEGETLEKRLWLVVTDDKGVELQVYTVDAEYINDELDVAWADGGNEHSHEFIPKNEIWLANTNSERRRWFQQWRLDTSDH